MPTILLAQEDPDAAAHLNALLQDFFPTAQLQLLTDFASVAQTLASGIRASLLLSDIFWADVDQSGPLLLLAEAYPETPIGIVSRFDLTQTLPPAYPIPWLKADDHLPPRNGRINGKLFRSVLRTLLCSLSCWPSPFRSSLLG